MVTSFSCQGRGSLVDLLHADPATCQELERKALKQLQLSDTAPPAPRTEDGDPPLPPIARPPEKLVATKKKGKDPDRGQADAPQEAGGALEVEDL